MCTNLRIYEFTKLEGAVVNEQGHHLPRPICAQVAGCEQDSTYYCDNLNECIYAAGGGLTCGTDKRYRSFACPTTCLSGVHTHHAPSTCNVGDRDRDSRRRPSHHSIAQITQ